MARTIAICTHKGGTGKTVTTLALAAGLANAGRRCLLIDLDPQAHSTIGAGIDPVEPTLKEFFERHPTFPLRDLIRRTPASESLHIVPSDLRLAWTAEGLAGRPKKEDLLRRSLKEVEGDYDWILIDTPPSLGAMMQNAVTAAEFLLIPTVPEARAANAIADLLELVHLMKGEGFQDYGILLTRLDSRKTRTNAAVLAALEPWMNKIFKTVIPESETLNQAQMVRQDIYRFDPNGAGAKAYLALTQEIMNL